MKLRARDTSTHDPAKISTRCPHCGHVAVLVPIGKDYHIGDNLLCGQRICPRGECHGHLFTVWNAHSDRIIAAYPPITIDFNTESIPVGIKKSFEEALTCHANGLFVASAIMVRRTLEEICDDKAAKGGDLKSRIKDLRTKILIPDELLQAMDELRLLGNDAAHIEAKTYAKIGNDELLAAIDVTKEIMKAIYQYSNLLGRLKALKKPPAA